MWFSVIIADNTYSCDCRIITFLAAVACIEILFQSFDTAASFLHVLIADLYLTALHAGTVLVHDVHDVSTAALVTEVNFDAASKAHASKPSRLHDDYFVGSAASVKHLQQTKLWKVGIRMRNY